MRLVDLPAPPHWTLLDCHHVNPPLMEPGTYAIDEATDEHGHAVETFVLSPGDVRGTRIVHALVFTGCWSLAGGNLVVACEGCGTLVASRTDDCRVAQETRFHSPLVVRETGVDEVDVVADPFALVADWDDAPPDTRRFGWVPRPTRPRPALTATRWGGRGVKKDLYRDDPPA
jgi:hypothetical protein